MFRFESEETISIHSLVKRETAKQDYDIYVIDIISIHSLVKRETWTMPAVNTGRSDFNPLPRKEGDFVRVILRFQSRISIHSLVKRETL